MAACLVADVTAAAFIMGVSPNGGLPGEMDGIGGAWSDFVAVIVFFSSLYVQLQGIERLMDKRKEKEFPAPKLPGDAWQQAPLDGFPRDGEPLH